MSIKSSNPFAEDVVESKKQQQKKKSTKEMNDEIEEMKKETKQSLIRTRRNVEESKQVATGTLVKLKENGETIDNANDMLGRGGVIDENLKQSKDTLKRFSLFKSLFTSKRKKKTNVLTGRDIDSKTSSNEIKKNSQSSKKIDDSIDSHSESVDIESMTDDDILNSISSSLNELHHITNLQREEIKKQTDTIEVLSLNVSNQNSTLDMILNNKLMR